MKKKWKIVFGAVLLLAALGFVVSQVMQGQEVEVKRAESTSVKRSFTEDGKVAPLVERNVYSPYSAGVEEVLVSEGDRVTRGELLAVLDESEMSFKIQELEAQLRRLEGERMQLEEEPGEAELESSRLAVEEAEEALSAAERNLERVERLYLESYKLSVEEAEENLNTAERNYERARRLYEDDIISRAEFEEARHAVRQAENHLAQQENALETFSEVEYDEAEELVRKAEYNLAQQEKALQVLQESYDPPVGSEKIIDAQKQAITASMDLLKYQKDKYRLTAPISGVVAEVNIKEDEFTGPEMYAVSLFQDEDYKIETKVLTSDVYEISEGMPVKLRLELRDGEITFAGEVREVSPYAEKSLSPLGLEEERVKITVAPEIPEDLEIAPGYRLDVEFTTEELHDALVVPKTALFTYQGEDALFVVEDGTAVVRAVTTGLETRQEVVIKSGIEEGDLVLLNPQADGVDEGSRVSYSVVNE